MLIRICFAFVVLFSTSLSAQTPDANQPYQVSDPLEPLNRVVWDFNYQILDPYIYRPVTLKYVDWVPTPGRKAINNFVLNFEEPSTMINNLLQLDFKHTAQAFFRFSVNSTFGLLGFLDVAQELGVPRRRESFSDLLGRWYVPNGPYLMLPAMGPTTPRKLLGNVVDGLYFPFSYLSFEEELGLNVMDALDKRESLLKQDALLEQSLDPYLFVRDAYSQREAFKFYGGGANVNQPRQENLPEAELEIDLDEFMDEID